VLLHFIYIFFFFLSDLLRASFPASIVCFFKRIKKHPASDMGEIKHRRKRYVIKGQEEIPICFGTCGVHSGVGKQVRRNVWMFMLCSLGTANLFLLSTHFR
jgi:hypothetical protein